MDTNNSINQKQDDYLPCIFYKGKTFSENGIYTFSEGGKYYFSFMENGNVILGSEGYQNEAGRESGIASVLKNMEQESQYKIIQLENGNWVLALFALNHQEIARSCPFPTEEEVKKLLPGARAKAKAELLLNASLNTAATDNFEREDDYLVCNEYEKRINERSADKENFIQFKHPSTNNYYFAWVTSDNKIILRSEGYASEASRDNGIISVIKNKGIKERFRIEEKRGLYYLVLTAGNQLEIGRSCPKKSEGECWALINPTVAAPVLAAAAVTSAINLDNNRDKEDDYLFCTEYHGHPVQDSINKIAFFRHGNGLYYFAVYDNGGKVKLRSEGFRSITDRELELKSVIELINSAGNYTTIERAGYQIKILKDNNGREIGRTCPKKIAIAPMAASIPASAPEAVGGGFKAWWLLGLLLLLGLFFFWKYINKTEVVTPLSAVEAAVPAATAAPVVKDTDGDGIKDDVDKCPNTAGIADNMGCPEMVFYYKRDDANLSAEEKADLDKLVDWMGRHPELSISVEGHTSTLGEAEYNQKLSEKRTRNSVNYLVSKGIDANRLKAIGYGEQFPIGDNSSEEGRAASRRVVIKIAK